MPARYVCGDEGRRRAVRETAGDLNGIDFIEVSEDQQRLSLHFLKTPIPNDINVENVVIEGGERITDLRVVEVAVANDSLDVGIDVPGDYSHYTLRLVDVDEIDVRLAQVRFSFKVNCAADFDYKSTTQCAPDVVREPDIDYLARDYASFRQLMLDRLSLLVPDWRERNPADAGVALVEVVAYVADHLSYYLDAVGTEAYLDTARTRIAVRRHARARDFFMHEGVNARAYVALSVEGNSSADGANLPGPSVFEHRPGTQLLSRFGSDQALVSTALLPEALNAGAMVFETLHDLTLHAALNGISEAGTEIVIRFYTWSDDRCCLPAGATAATLRGPLSELEVGDLLLFEEVLGAHTGTRADADPAHRHVVRLTQLEADVDRIDDTPVVEIQWDQADALPFPLCLSSVDSQGVAISDVSIARGNVVLADQGDMISEELTFSEEAEFGLTLEGAPLTHAVPLPHDFHLRPAAEFGRVDPHQALPQIQLIDSDGQHWEARRDLLGSGPLDRHFVAEMGEDGRARLRFGRDGQGMRPVRATAFTAFYCVGNGPKGNVGAEAIAHIVGAPTGIRAVRNPLPAWGGESPESLERVRALAPYAFKVQERAVTEEDYACVAERHPEVQHAAATLECTGNWTTVFLTIDRRAGLPVLGDSDFLESMTSHMGRFRMAGHDLEINSPHFVPLDMSIRICVEPDYFRGEIRTELLRRLGSGSLPDGRPAFFHPDRWTFNQSVYLSQIYAAILTVNGVASAVVTRFQRWGRAAAQERNDGVLAIHRLEIARLDNNPNFPESGRLQLDMEGGR
jgi:hypothetical protein